MLDCLWISWLDKVLPIISGWVLRTNASILFLALPPISLYFASLFGTVHCPFSPREAVQPSPVHPNPWHDIFLKTATIPNYHAISIAIPRYIAMQHLSFSWLDIILHCHTCFCLIIEPHDSWAFPLHLFATWCATIIAYPATLAEAYICIHHYFFLFFFMLSTFVKVCWSCSSLYI